MTVKTEDVVIQLGKMVECGLIKTWNGAYIWEAYKRNDVRFKQGVLASHSIVELTNQFKKNLKDGN
jgi:hypothetical protein